MQLAPLAACTWLVELNLSECYELRQVPAAVTGLPALRCLLMARCDLEVLPEGPHRNCLQKLDISHNK